MSAPGSQVTSLLQARGLCAGYGGAQVLTGLDLTLQPGEVVALLGRNGAGKSTTFKAIMGLLAQRRGEVRFAGTDISRWPPYRIARLGLGYVPQERRIFGDLTVRENLAVGRQPARRWPDGRAAPAWDEARLFGLFPNLGEMPDRPGARMSGGEQQMLTVARTLMGNPLLLLLDEPSEGVAPLIVEQMAHTLQTLKREGVGILLAEQNLHFAALVADRAYVLEKGQICYHGPLEALLNDAALQDRYLGI